MRTGDHKAGARYAPRNENFCTRWCWLHNGLGAPLVAGRATDAPGGPRGRSPLDLARCRNLFGRSSRRRYRYDVLALGLRHHEARLDPGW
jgi:hypothetical protein